MSTHRIEKHGICKSCKGTGLYVGMAERDGFAVVCTTCKGSGEKVYVLEWDDFYDLLAQKDVHTVVRTNPGICLGGDIDFGGMPYADWLAGKPFPPGSEDRTHTCPAWFYQSADYEKKPNWEECGFGAFSACSSFTNKHQCWVRWDEEFTNDPNK